MGVTQQLFIPLHVGVEDHRTFVVVRPDRDFSDVDLALAHRLQPVLLGLERQVAELARRRAWRDKAQEAVDDLRLTERDLTPGHRSTLDESSCRPRSEQGGSS